ncbi:MAG: hypothetical protein ACK4N1_19645, partial [Pseudorhizobium sp.]
KVYLNQCDVHFFQFCECQLLTVCGSGRISRFTEREAAPHGPPDWFRKDLEIGCDAGFVARL